MPQKIGIHLSFWQTNWSDDVTPFIGHARKAGFDGVEFPLLQPKTFDLQSALATLEAHGMQATCGTGLSPATDITAENRAPRQAGLEHLRACMEIAAALSSPVLAGVTYAPWAHFPNDDLQPYRRRCIESLREAGMMAGDLGVLLCLEVLNRFECYLFNTVQAGLELLTEVDSPNIKLHLDTFHLNIEEEDIGVAIQAAGPQLRYFHAAENNRRRPGVGHIPWDTVAGALREISYEGWIVMEAFVRHEGEVGRTLSIWNPLVDDLETEASEGAAFLRQKMGKKESVA